MHEIQCNEPRDLYVTSSNMPVCLYPDTYQMLLDRGISLSLPPTPESVVRGVVDETIAMYDSDPDGAFATITAMMSTDPSYPFVIDSNAIIVAHGSNPDRVGANSTLIASINKPIDMIISELQEGEVWVEYTFNNPATGTEQHKRSLFVLHDGYIFGSGYYASPESVVRGVVDETIAMYDSDPDGAFATITAMMSTDPSYPFVIDSNAIIVAHGSNPDRVGANSTLIASINKPIDMIISELQEGEVWVEYTFNNPATGTEQHKRSLFVLHDGYIFGSGYYASPESVVRGVVDETIAMYDSDPDGAFATITAMMSTDPSYPFVIDSNAIIVAHGSNPDRVGANSTLIASINKPIDMIISELQEGEVWVEYTFNNPATGTEQHKRSLFVLHDGYIFGSGYYASPESVVRGVVDETIAMYDSDPDGAFATITAMMSTDPSYPFVIDSNAIIVAHGSNPDRVGANSTLIASINKPIDMIISELQEGEVWVEYTFNNPATGTEQHKRSLFVLHDGYIFGSGYYASPESVVRGVVDETIAMYDSDPDGAFATITAMMSTDPSYPFVIDSNAIIVAHGSNPDRVGANSTLIASINKPIDMIISELQEGEVWVEYTFNNPATGTEQHKRSLFVLHDGYIFGSGYYASPESVVRGVVDETIAMYDSDPDGAFATITAMMSTDPSYPFVIDSNAIIVAHGSNPDHVGANSTLIASINKPIDMIISELQEGEVWVEYTFNNPATGTEQHKRSLFVLHDGYIFGSGYYVAYDDAMTDKMTDAMSSLELTAEETAWLEENSAIRVAFDPGWLPIEYADEEGNLAGVTLQYTSEFSRLTGADFAGVPAAASWSDALAMMQNGEADAMYMIASTPERLEYMNFTTSHYTVEARIVTSTDRETTLEDENISLITIEGYAIEAWLDENHPGIEYTSVANFAEGLELMKTGEEYAFAATWPVIVTYAETAGIDVYNAGSTGYQYDLNVGYSNENPILGSILQKVVDAIPASQVEQWWNDAVQ